MSKLLIDKEKLENRIKDLEEQQSPLKFGQELYYEELEHRIEELQSILQQGEEYNENEAVEFLLWFLKHPSIEYYKKLNNFYYIGKYYTIQELYKLYKNERNIKEK